MSITAFPVMARILKEREMTHTTVGRLALTGAAVRRPARMGHARSSLILASSIRRLGAAGANRSAALVC